MSVTPFASPRPNSNNNFTPSRSTMSGGGGGSATQTPPLKPPKPPEKPLVPYMRFSRKMWHKVRDQNPESQLWDIGRKIGAIWREMTDGEKRQYQEEYENEKVDYDKLMKQYHNSAAYQAYLANKNRAKMMEQQAAQQAQQAAAQQQQAAAVQTQQAQALPPSRERHPHPRVESGVFIQAVDEDDGESQVSVRRMAATRYDRNHRLIADLFSDSVVQDTRSITTQQRINMLKRQAASLATHQKNLENELVTLETKFQDKKRQIEDSSQRFADKLKKVCEDKPVIDEERYKGMVTQATGKLLQAYNLYKLKHETPLNKAHSGWSNDAGKPQESAANGSSSTGDPHTTPLTNGECGKEDGVMAGKHLPVTEKISSTISEDSKEDQMGTETKGGTEEEEEVSESENHLLEEDEDD